MTLYTIIDVKEQKLKDRLAVTCDNQPFIATAPLVLVYCADYRRWYQAFCQVEGTKLMGNAHSVCAPAEGRNTPGAGFYCEHRCVGQQAAGKMASEFQKPDQVHTLFTWEIERKMWPLPVNELFWVGPATARKLRALE